MSERFFAPCPRGLEAPLAAELEALGAADVARTDGGVGFAGELSFAYRANLESRLASRIYAAAPQTGRGGREQGSILGGLGNLLDGDGR